MLAVFCTLLLLGVNLASLNALLYLGGLLDNGLFSCNLHHACSFVGEPFMGITESRGGGNTQLKHYVDTRVM